MHAAEIAALIGCETVIVPPLAGVASAFGATMMDVRHDLETTFYMACEGADLGALNERLGSLEDEGRLRLEAEGFTTEEITIERTAGMRYVGQSYEVDTPLPLGELDADAVELVAEEFNACHLREHGVASAQFPAAFVNLRTSAAASVAKPDLSDLFAEVSVANGSPANGSPAKLRRVRFGGAEYDTPIHQRNQLGQDTQLDGPTIIEDANATVFVPPGDRASVDELGNVLISVGING